MAKTGRTWAETAKMLGVSTAAMSQWKTGKTKPRKRALYLLSEAERTAGITPPEQNFPMVVKETAEKFQGLDKKELRKLVAEMRVTLARAEKILGE